MLDYEYRRFYSAYDKIEDTTAFEPLRDLVENIYTNEYLETLLPEWNSAMQEPDAFTQLPLQRDFYACNLKNAKERTVIIISDAMRYDESTETYRRLLAQIDRRLARVCDVVAEVNAGQVTVYKGAWRP